MKKKYYHSTPSIRMMHLRQQTFSIATNEISFVLNDEFKIERKRGRND